MPAETIHNPFVPCVYHIPGGMYPGKSIRVEGSTPINAKRFAINLQCGPTIEHHDDIAFHFNVRFDGYCLVMNHYYGRSWWQEERDESRLPIKEGESFEAVILCRLNSIKVSINNTHFYEFKHRLPYQRITYITIVEDVILKSISFEDA